MNSDTYFRPILGEKSSVWFKKESWKIVIINITVTVNVCKILQLTHLTLI
jgi:hypothetical protein